MVNRICKGCGKEFKVYLSEVKRGNGKYCSRECYNNGNSIIRICKQCNKPFKCVLSKSIDRGIYCSQKCYWLSKRKVTKVCPECGTFFQVDPAQLKIGWGIYCSNECRYGANWKGGNKLSYKRYYLKSRKDNIQYQLSTRISNLIRKSLKNGVKNGRHWETLVPYTYKQLKKHLQKTLPENYNWSDFLKSNILHIDHIRPISSFIFKKPEDLQFQRCWALDNLQLLPARENRQKSNKLLKPFQTALAVSI